jgi:hypothetical protein
VYSPTATINELVETSGTLPDFSDSVELVPPLPMPLNSAGETAFGAQVGSIPNVQVGTLDGFVLPGNSQPGFQGFFLSTPTGAPAKVVGSGDPVPGTGVNFSFPHFISGLDDNGDLAFTAASGSVSDGVFLAPATGNIQTVALDGGAAPGGGTFSLASTASVGGVISGIFYNLALMNNEADMAFRAGIAAGAGDSGYFRQLHAGSGEGNLLPIVVQGQAVPGGGTFSTFSVPDTQGSDFALGPDGALAFVNNFTNGSSGKQGAFVARTDGTLLKVLATGDTAPGGGTVSGLSMS